MHTHLTRWAIAALLAGAASVSAAQHWAATWTAPPQPAWADDFVLPLGMPRHLDNVTLRQALRTSIGGDRLRLVVSNAYGEAPLRIGAAHVGLDGSDAGMPVTFEGSKDVVVAAGATAVSDPVALRTAAGARLVVDVYLPTPSRLAGFHWDAREQALLQRGDTTGRKDATAGEKLPTRAFLSAVLVESARRPVAVVALGDSITDGNGSTPGADRRWPDHLARRLAARGVAVLNAGISGNRLLRAGMGESALARLDRDVLQQPGVRAVIVLLGTNDIGWPGGPFAPHEALPSTADIAAGFRQLVQQARLRGVRVIGATLPPFEDALQGTPLEGHHSPRKEAIRQAVNEWIRHAGAFDAVVDFDRLLRDPARPSRMRPDFDSGDHLHPGDAGYRAMADAIDLQTLFESSRSIP
ncbi:SGNH/GDSL hydrolase family protein [Ramlibacter pallidus]|uniref:SGNH/GDSL hydrolase family protein n=1 Tax=Ramlibacter pallidus TaxID=2780087 RepID=A0ABR9S928_9BURK|nr:SGNH/GDSL hydrolase family protein [Ramlibacter pallidus]MBE7369544.1 SGNH/GDSL hydrolase family protein [Ramlibacter pallidus]